MPAVVTKRFGTCSVKVRVFPRGGTWHCHVEQLRPRYVDQEDTDPGPVQIQTMEPVVSLQEATLLADGAPTPAMAQMPVPVRPISRKPEVCTCRGTSRLTGTCCGEQHHIRQTRIHRECVN